jgi:hypothetical protein
MIRTLARIGLTTFVFLSTSAIAFAQTPKATDYDGDGKSDLTTYRPSSGTSYVLKSSGGFSTAQIWIPGGNSTDIPAPGDYDGDGKTDAAYFRPSTGQWQIIKSSSDFTTSITVTCGVSGDLPVPGDYDGDGKTDVAVFHRATGEWRIVKSSNGSTTTIAWGMWSDIPVPGDYDGDGKTDAAVFHPSTNQWQILKSSTSTSTMITWGSGVAGDIPVPGDYDGDGKTDLATYRPWDATHQHSMWWVLESHANYTTQWGREWGAPTDVPVPGDYDGDGKTDLVTYRPTDPPTGTTMWFVLESHANYTTQWSHPWGGPNDQPGPNVVYANSRIVYAGPKVSEVTRAGDFDRDGRTDLTVFRRNSGTWYTRTSVSGYVTETSIVWGTSTDLPVPGDYDGDGRTDPAYFRPSTGEWHILQSSTNYATNVTIGCGVTGDLPVPGDYDGDGKTDVAVFHPPNGQWQILKSSTGTTLTITWGTWRDVPVPADYEGDGKTDVAVYHPSNGQWQILYSSSGASATFVFGGANTDLPVPGDYDGDGLPDLALYRGATGTWWVLESHANYTTQWNRAWGGPTDVPVPGDYDGDGKMDLAVFRPFDSATSSPMWWLRQSSSGYSDSTGFAFGSPTDLPAGHLTLTSVAVTAPFPGTIFYAPSSVLVTANVATNVPIASVSLYAGSTLLGTVSVPSYEVTWWTPVVGSYALTAVAVDTVGHQTTSAAVNVSISTGSGAGTLGTPIAFPPGGTSPMASTLVTLTAASGATTRYTLTGATPTSSSPVYTQPLVIDQSLTLKAAAFQSGWTTSPTLTAAYTIDATPPLVTAIYSPGQTASGWNHGPVTVSFVCADSQSAVSSCPSPVSFANEGAGQSATVAALDSLGNERRLTVVANIDATAPSATLTSPASNITVTSPSLAVTGLVGDTLSGLQTVLCNGTAGSVVNGSVSCTVTLGPGNNVITLQAIDNAENVTSASAVVTLQTAATSVAVSPSTISLGVGETSTLQALDQVGRLVTGATWSSSNTSVATVGANGLVTAVAAGQTTVSATAGSFTGSGVVTVYQTLAVGTVLWSVDSPAGVSVGCEKTGVSGVDGTSLAQVCVNNGSFLLLQGLTSDGQTTWTRTVPIAANENLARPVVAGTATSGDMDGGVLIKTRIDGEWFLTRVDPSGGQNWRYAVKRQFTGQAQAPDGTIFLTTFEPRPNVPKMSPTIVGLDGATGQKKFEIVTPWSQFRSAFNFGCLKPFDVTPSLIGRPTVDANGVANVLVVTSVGDECYPYQGGVAPQGDLLLYRITTAGSLTIVPLQHLDATTSLNGAALNDVLPDDQGGVVASWVPCAVSGQTTSCPSQSTARYVTNAGAGSQYLLQGIPFLSGSGGRGYAGGSAFDMPTGQIEWTRNDVAPVAVLQDNQLRARDTSGNSVVLSPTGATIATDQSVVANPMMYLGDRQIGETGLDDGVYAVRAGVNALLNQTGFGQFDGDSALRRAVRRLGTGIFAKAYEVGAGYFHVGIQVLPNNQERWVTRQGGDPLCSGSTGNATGSCFSNPWWAPDPREPNGTGPGLFVGYFATIAAENSVSGCSGGTLDMGINRGQDVNNPIFSNSYRERLNYDRNREDSLIARLFSLASTFHSGEMPYYCFPTVNSPTFNSNSFASGLLIKAPVSLPVFPANPTNFPGWNKPVPLTSFTPH